MIPWGLGSLLDDASESRLPCCDRVPPDVVVGDLCNEMSELL